MREEVKYMFIIRAEKVSKNKALIDEKELRDLVRIANRVEAVKLIETESDLPIEGIMKLADEGGGLDFLEHEGEDIYSINDLKVRYK